MGPETQGVAVRSELAAQRGVQVGLVEAPCAPRRSRFNPFHFLSGDPHTVACIVSSA